MPNFGVNGETGEAYFTGTVEATAGKFGTIAHKNNGDIDADYSSYWNIEMVYDYDNIGHAALVGVGTADPSQTHIGSPYIQTGNWQISDNYISTRKYINSSDSSRKIGYYSNDGYYYDFGMKVITPDEDSDSTEYKKSLFYIRKADTKHGVPSFDSSWTYPFRVDSDGHLYCTDLTIIGSGTGTTYVPVTGDSTINGSLTITGTLTATASAANKLATTKTIITNLASTNGAAYTGETNITPGVTGILGVAHGGTGKEKWTQWGLVYASGTTTLAQVAAGTSGQILKSGGNAAPSWVNQSALSVGTATKATQDADGNVISSTYRKLDNNVFDTIQVTDLTAGDLMVTGVGRFTNGLYGDLIGNADTATTAATADKVGSNLVILLNGGTTEGTNKFTYNGSATKNVNITKSGIGLGNVENTALSTWAGSANLTTTKVGTLAAAATKGVDTSISASSTSANLPTSAAVATFVEGKGYVTSSGVTSVRV